MSGKKLHGDSSTIELNNSSMVPSKGASSPSDARSCVSSIGDTSGSVKEGDVDHEYLPTDQNVLAANGYYGYYYPGYGGFYGEPENQGYYVGADAAVDLQYPGAERERREIGSTNDTWTWRCKQFRRRPR